MARRHNTILHERVALAAGAVPLDKDLPINPISFLTIALKMLNDGVATIPTMANILGVLANVEVLLDGRSLVQGSLVDLAAMTTALWGVGPVLQPITGVDDNVLHCAVHIPFGRQAWMQNEALPTTRKGDLTLRLTPAAAFTGVNTLTLTVEVRQILDVAPERFLKYVTSTKTPTATGPHEVDLLTGPDYIGTLFYGTTKPHTDSQNASIGKLKLKVDDVEQMIPETRFEALYAEWQSKWNLPHDVRQHIHVVAGAAETLIDHMYAHYLYVDFDPMKDLTYRLITRGRSRCHYVITADVADAIRFLPVEVVGLTTEAGAPA
jgi:hypothetical protein